MNEQQTFWVKYATALQRLSRADYSMNLQIDCVVPDDEDARMMQYDNSTVRNVGKLISARYAWDGQIACWVRLSDVRMSNDQLRPLTEFLTAASPYLNALGEAVVESHRDNFRHFIDTFESTAWRKASLKEGTCQFRLQSAPELGPHIVLTLTARLVADVLRAAESRKVTAFRHHVQLYRYASMLLRLARGRHPVTLSATTLTDDAQPSTTADWAGDGMDDGARWQGDVSVIVNQRDLGVTVSFIRSFRPLLDEKREFTDWLGEALLASRLDDFEAYVAGVAPNDWEYAAVCHRHRHWGLEMYPASGKAPYQLAFLCHVSRIAQALNDRLVLAAAEGAR